MRKMLRQMGSGEPVRVAPAMATMKKLTRLAFYAEQFGYAYADVRQGGGPQGNGYVLLLVPDPDPGARARAARNRELYPHASGGGPLPPLGPEAVELFKARITFDITTMYTDKQRILLTGVGVVPIAVPLGILLGTGGTAVAIGFGVWAVLMGIAPIGLAVTRRHKARYSALLEAAGFTPVTDQGGRLRYVPPDGQLPGHGNPFAVGT
ncbi:hypothetical protein [Streptomyces iconiensis]|uniref:Integral membrane protein n=1 Tax=Streptomyces iconiensis TaxID=1384038 RepID=A0ABT7A1D9_9ACTN|nr:hypothetical protein [Streptomyces iconiensis]MDJ1134428.1 hypothetical protein [Streptomyces iconiensis]